jgi:hypothetical protein
VAPICKGPLPRPSPGQWFRHGPSIGPGSTQARGMRDGGSENADPVTGDGRPGDGRPANRPGRGMRASCGTRAPRASCAPQCTADRGGTRRQGLQSAVSCVCGCASRGRRALPRGEWRRRGRSVRTRPAAYRAHPTAAALRLEALLSAAMHVLQRVWRVLCACEES